MKQNNYLNINLVVCSIQIMYKLDEPFLVKFVDYIFAQLVEYTK